MALREVLAHFGFTFDRAGLDAAGRGIEKVKNETAGAGKSLTGFVDGLRGAIAGVAAGAFVALTDSIKDQAAALKDTSEQTGLATDELQAWTLAANLGGASAQDFVAGLRKVSKELATGVDESGQQSKLFERLGIDTKDAEGNVRDLSAVLPEIAEKFAGLKSGAERSALAQQIFGKAGSKLVPILAQGAAGVAALRALFEELGGGFSQEAIDRADEYDDALIKLNFSFFGLKSLLATQVFPWLAKTVGELTKASVSAGKWLKETTAVSSGVKILAAILGGTLLKALAPFLLPGLKFLAIFLAVDDLIGFLQGKDSVIGKILNGWFGDGTATTVRLWVNDAIASMQTFWTALRDGSAISSHSASGFLETFIIDAGNGFKFLRSEVSVIMASIVFLFQNAVLEMEVAWNGFVGSLKLPPALSKALKIDTSDQVVTRTNALVDASVKKSRSDGIERRYVSDARRALTGREGPTVAQAPAGPGAAPIITNNTPINVKIDAQGVAPKDFKVLRQAVTDGIKSGLSGLDGARAALQNLDQKAPAR